MPSPQDEKKPRRHGHPLADDPAAESASRDLPAFLARPANAPAYHGLQVLSDVCVDGFTFGKISDFEAELANEGDAFVIAPDNSRAGLVWEVSNRQLFVEVAPVTDDRWGVWEVSFPYPMTSRDNVRRNLQAILPQLKNRWEQWRSARANQGSVDHSSVKPEE
jgi:hypothetical protein